MVSCQSFSNQREGSSSSKCGSERPSMHILNIIQCTNLGGMEQASLRLMVNLQSRGHQCRVLSLNPVGDLGPLLNQDRIFVEGLPYRGKGGWRSFPLLKNKIKDLKGDVLIMTGHNYLAMTALGNLCKDNRVLSMHYHHTGVKPAWEWRLIYRKAMQCFKAIIFPSDFVRHEAENILPSLKAISHTITNQLPIQKFRDNNDRSIARRTLEIPDNVPVIGNAGWLIPRKRFDIFLQVAGEVVKNRRDSIFLIAGNGPERYRLECFAKSKGIYDNVRWLGWKRDLSVFYHSIDVMLFNSDWDAFPTSPLEAMAHGIPVVASVKNGGLSEVISKPDYGFLTNQHDISWLSGKVLLLLHDFRMKNRIGVEGRNRVTDVCSVDKCVDRYISVLR